MSINSNSYMVKVNLLYKNNTHTHTYIYIYIYIYKQKMKGEMKNSNL